MADDEFDDYDETSTKITTNVHLKHEKLGRCVLYVSMHSCLQAAKFNLDCNLKRTQSSFGKNLKKTKKNVECPERFVESWDKEKMEDPEITPRNKTECNDSTWYNQTSKFDVAENFVEVKNADDDNTSVTKSMKLRSFLSI
ncbi:hypothetical protein HELRODRAFT_184177 [Helobdella robusta]|uniref:Uncharacterized protein n=1 Tax=Helobdella robusta TaxID=6412 RepID=T1FKQ2_HELRO|nr:hypothetical protein HELRODRAFT_184177 [Helobdella robusta]ESO06746.1 hypothetical protein HELRODRAFT_184177 [Helobdella robusta]